MQLFLVYIFQCKLAKKQIYFIVFVNKKMSIRLFFINAAMNIYDIIRTPLCYVVVKIISYEQLFKCKLNSPNSQDKTGMSFFPFIIFLYRMQFDIYADRIDSGVIPFSQ